MQYGLREEEEMGVKWERFFPAAAGASGLEPGAEELLAQAAQPLDGFC